MIKKLNISHIGFVVIGIFFAFFLLLSVSVQQAHAAIANQLSIGSTGADVTQLQQFLASNSQIYPAGIVSGYYGPLTQAAVIQFQVTYGIPQVGRVGPQTMAKINNIMASGFGLDTSVPVINNLSAQTSANSAVINWTTNEAARGQVFYDTSPIQSNEATAPYQLPYIGGIQADANSNQSVSNTQSIRLSGLQSHTFYYFVVRSIDSSGNVSMSIPQSFQTN